MLRQSYVWCGMKIKRALKILWYRCTHNHTINAPRQHTEIVSERGRLREGEGEKVIVSERKRDRESDWLLKRVKSAHISEIGIAVRFFVNFMRSFPIVKVTSISFYTHSIILIDLPSFRVQNKWTCVQCVVYWVHYTKCSVSTVDFHSEAQHKFKSSAYKKH